MAEEAKKYYIRAGAHSSPAGNFIVESLLARRGSLRPLLSHAVRTKPGNTEVIQVGVVALNSSPAVDVEFLLDPWIGLLKDRVPVPTIRLPIVDLNTPFFIDTTVAGRFDIDLSNNIAVLLKYHDVAGNEYEYRSQRPRSLHLKLCRYYAEVLTMSTYLITGANQGIGYEYCRQLLSRGDRPIAVCRNSSPELDALGIRIIAGIDLTQDSNLATLPEQLQGERIDVLVNNAGIIERVTLANLDLESIRRQFEVNALSPLRVTHTLLGNLTSGSKIIMMTSRMGSIADNTSGGSYGYRMSKVALCMAGKSLAHDLLPQGIAVGILHPGLVQTRMTGFTGITTETAVRGLLARIDELTLDNSGTFWHSNGEVLPW